MNSLYFLVIAILITSCSNSKNSKSNKRKLFEGAILYSVEYKPYSPLFKEDKLKELIGAKIKVFFKDGNYKKQSFSSKGKLLSERYLDLAEHKSYYKQPNNDTIYWFDITKNDNKTIFKPLADTVILNQPLKVVETESSILVKEFGQDSIKLKGYYFFSKKYKINPNWYKDYNEDAFYQITKYGKGIQLFSSIQGIFWGEEVTLKNIKPRKINKEQIELVIEENNVLVEL